MLAPRIALFCLLSGGLLATVLAVAQETAPLPSKSPSVVVRADAAPSDPAGNAPAVHAEAAVSPPLGMQQTLTLEVMIRQGGVILWVIMGLGFIAFVLALYFLLTLTPRREAPRKLARRAQTQLLNGEVADARRMCEDRDELLANVLAAGLKMAGHDRFIIQEAMESEGERGAAMLWQRIAYLSNIGTLAPLLGLLGTVWGMMQAFSGIAFETAQARELTMAYSVAQAMITTAAGLVVAIPVMAVYYFLKGRVVKIIAEVESQAAELLDLIAKARET